MWQFYDTQLPDICAIRPAFFLRVVIVDAAPLQSYLEDQLRADRAWQVRCVVYLSRSGFLAQSCTAFRPDCAFSE